MAPAELEALLLTHAAVQDTAVVGVSNKEAGEVPRAYVVLKPNVTAVTQNDLVKFVSGLSILINYSAVLLLNFFTALRIS